MTLNTDELANNHTQQHRQALAWRNFRVLASFLEVAAGDSPADQLKIPMEKLQPDKNDTDLRAHCILIYYS